MLNFLPAQLKGALALMIFFLNTVLWCVLLYPWGLLKILIPVQPVRRLCNAVMVFCAESWIDVNGWSMGLFHKIHWTIQGLDGLDPEKSYLICSNHQSWVDIVVLQKIFNHRVPFLRFFLKQQLIYVPFLGAAWWALDFPFMKRHGKAYLKKHPEKRGEDMATTKRSCERFRGTSISILNFVEGTRFSPQKKVRQNSPYDHLLSPKAGGVAFVLEAMGDQFAALLDVTIIYPDQSLNLWALFCGKIDRILVQVEKQPIPQSLLRGNYLNDLSLRTETQAWISNLWRLKDQKIALAKKGAF